MTFYELWNIQSENEGKSKLYSDYFRAKQTFRNTSVMAPPELRKTFFTSVPYCRLACQVLNERIDLDSLSAETDEATKFLNDTLQVNGDADFVAAAHILSMEYGRSYLVPTGSDREDGLPMIQIVPGRDMVHRINAYTGEITEAIQVFGYLRDRYVYWNLDQHTRFTLVKRQGSRFPDATVVFPPDDTYTEDPGYPGFYIKQDAFTGEIPVYPLTCRGEPTNTFGRPEAKDIFSLQDSSSRIATDMAIASALMGVPKEFLIGAEDSDFSAHDEDGNPIPGTQQSPTDIYMARLITISEPTAKLAQAQAAQLNNFSTGLNTNTRFAAAAMGVPQSVFGVSSDANPSSSDSMQEDDKRLIRRAEQLTRGFNPGWLALCRYLLRANGFGDQTVSTRWVDPSLPNLASRVDAVQKLSLIQSGGAPLYDWQELRERLGDSADEIKAAEGRREVAQVQALLNAPTQTAPAASNTPPTQEAASEQTTGQTGS